MFCRLTNHILMINYGEIRCSYYKVVPILVIFFMILISCVSEWNFLKEPIKLKETLEDWKSLLNMYLCRSVSSTLFCLVTSLDVYLVLMYKKNTKCLSLEPTCSSVLSSHYPSGLQLFALMAVFFFLFFVNENWLHIITGENLVDTAITEPVLMLPVSFCPPPHGW